MNGYRTALQESDGYGSSVSDHSGVRSYRFASVFIPSLAPAYPDMAGELRKDVVILKSSLDIRNRYIDDLREAKDSLARKLDMREIQIDCLKKDIKRYQEFFYRTKEQEKVQ